MTSVYVIYHGPSEADKNHVICGQTDARLSNEGWNQARMIANMLKDKEFRKIYTSEMDRAFATAKEISLYHKCDVEIIEDLNDWNMGLWEGLTFAELKKTYEDKYQDWKKNPWDTRMTNGETLSEFLSRIEKFYNEKIKGEKSNIAVVSHRRGSRLLMGLLEGRDPRQETLAVYSDSTDASCRSFSLEGKSF